MGPRRRWMLSILGVFSLAYAVSALTAFEKVTGADFRGETYYTIRNLSLWECQGWCREEPECKAASFSFVLNPMVPEQNTVCLLQNYTEADTYTIAPQKAVSLYYMVKLHVPTEKVCNNPWTFERVPRKMLIGYDSAMVFTSSKEDCLAACLKEENFVCRSVEYNHQHYQCRLSDFDRRSAYPDAALVPDNNTDYFENLCLTADNACLKKHRVFEQPKQIGVPYNVVSDYVDLYYYTDKELMANTMQACSRACAIETEFLCKSFLFLGPPTGTEYNCRLYHLDHFTLPDGASTFLKGSRPIFDHNREPGKYFENVCKDEAVSGQQSFSGSSGSHSSGSGGGSTGGSSGGGGGGGRPVGGGGGGGSSEDKDMFGGGGSIISGGGQTQTGTQIGADASQTGGGYFGPGAFGSQSGDPNCDTCYNVSVHCKDTRIIVQVLTKRGFNGRIYALGRSETCNIRVVDSTDFRLDLTMGGQDCNTQSIGGVYTNTIVIQRHSIVMTKTDKIYKVRCTYDMSSKNISFGMLPIRDPDMIPITSAPVAPSPIIKILDLSLNEVQTVRIGDKLIFRIEIPEQTPYGIMARSCVAMAKDSRTTFQIIDDDGCPVEPGIFPRFTQDGTALQAVYEAFRFTESYGVIFQCNVKYCLGACQPAKCQTMPGMDTFYSYGRKKRGLRELDSQSLRGHVQQTTKEEVDESESEEEMSISQEILVLDLGDPQNPQYKHSSKPSVQENYYTNRTMAFQHPEVTLFETCPTRSSVLALAVTCAVLLLIYVLTVFYFAMKRWVRPPIKTIH